MHVLVRRPPSQIIRFGGGVTDAGWWYNIVRTMGTSCEWIRVSGRAADRCFTEGLLADALAPESKSSTYSDTLPVNIQVLHIASGL